MPLHTPIAVASLVSLRAIYHKVLGAPEQHDHQGRFMRIIRIVGVVIGLVIVTVLIREVGWKEIKHSLGLLRWGYGAVILYPLTWMTLNTTGWRLALHKQFSKVPLWRMMQVRQAG